MSVYSTKAAIQKLGFELKINVNDKYSQDWEYENADFRRLNEFVSYYKNARLTDEEKFVLMRLILESFNDGLSSGEDPFLAWQEVVRILLGDSKIHESTIQEWLCTGEELENCYKLTPLLRKAVKQKKGREISI